MFFSAFRWGNRGDSKKKHKKWCVCVCVCVCTLKPKLHDTVFHSSVLVKRLKIFVPVVG